MNSRHPDYAYLEWQVWVYKSLIKHKIQLTGKIVYEQQKEACHSYIIFSFHILYGLKTVPTNSKVLFPGFMIMQEM